MRRLAYGGGFGRKVHDFLTADLCPACHRFMDTLSRDKATSYVHIELFLHFIVLTIERRFVQGVVIVRGQREPRPHKIPKILPRRI